MPDNAPIDSKLMGWESFIFEDGGWAAAPMIRLKDIYNSKSQIRSVFRLISACRRCAFIFTIRVIEATKVMLLLPVSTQPQPDVVRSQRYDDPSTAASASLSCDGSTEPRMMNLRVLLANATDVTGGLPGSGRASRDDINRAASHCSSTRLSRSRVHLCAAVVFFLVDTRLCWS